MSESDFGTQLYMELTHLEDGLKRAKNKAGREAAIEALRVTIEFINSIPRFESQMLGLNLVKLLSGIEDLDNGQQVPLLVPVNFGNRPPDSGMRDVIKAVSIFAVNSLVRAKPRENLESACKYVAGFLEELGIEVGHKNRPSWKTIKEWRYERTRLSEQIKNTLEAFEKEIIFPENISKTELKVVLAEKLPLMFHIFSE